MCAETSPINQEVRMCPQAHHHTSFSQSLDARLQFAVAFKTICFATTGWKYLETDHKHQWKQRENNNFQETSHPNLHILFPTKSKAIPVS